MPWTVQQVVEYASKRTERRADSKIDLKMDFFLALDEFCLERHFWWLKKRFVFNTVIAANQYDLSATAANGNIQPGGGLTDYAQLDELIMLPPTGPAVINGIPQTTRLTPIFEPDAELAALNNTTSDVPSAYFIDTQTSLTTLVLQAPANAVRTILGTYWAIPQITDTTTENIPSFIPSFLHWGLFIALERRIFRFLYGQKDPRYLTADAEYKEFIEKASNIQHWSGKRARSVSVDHGSVNIVRAHQ